MNVLLDAADKPVALIALGPAQLESWLAAQPAPVRQWAQANAFAAQSGSWCAMPGADGNLSQVLVGVGDTPDLYALAHLPYSLPVGRYALADSGSVASWGAQQRHDAALGFALGAYRFTRYRSSKREPAQLVVPSGVDAGALRDLVGAVYLVRDLINTPTEDMGPEQLAVVAQTVGQAHGATIRTVFGDELLEQNFPAIHAVGRASHRAPRLIELNWGNPAHPRIAIIGKGVCFDTGGLDIKPADGMRWMKKDMGGSAQTLGLAQLIMARRLPVRLQVLIPAVENAISANSYRPGDVIATRAKISVEIDNTDAEGRVVLCDALCYAAESKPELLIDFATLTGAARVALGPELPALFSNRDDLAAALMEAGRGARDPLWHMPLWQPYRSMLESTVADMANSGGSRMAGAITAALYLQRFVPEDLPWAHIDVYSWNDANRAGRPRGGEAQAMRAVFALLAQRYR